MNIVTMIHIDSGKKYQGFLMIESYSHKMHFYFFDELEGKWMSMPIEAFKPVPPAEDNKVLGE